MSFQPPPIPPPFDGFRPDLFAGRVVAVTGAGHGIGQATLLKAARLGAAVVALELRPDHLDATRAELGRLGTPDSLCLLGDVADTAFLESAVAAIGERWGRLDGWVNNAFATAHAPVEELPLEAFQRAWEVNVRAPMHAAQLTLKLFRKAGGGSIVNLSSVLAHRTRRQEMPYASSKGGLEGLTRALAYELGPERVRVNTVIPGAVETGKYAAGLPKRLGPDASPERYEAAMRLFELVSGQEPIRETGRPDDLANAIVFLLSDAARFITGVALPVDGGFLINGTSAADERRLAFFREYLELREKAGLPPRK